MYLWLFTFSRDLQYESFYLSQYILQFIKSNNYSTGISGNPTSYNIENASTEEKQKEGVVEFVNDLFSRTKK